MAARCLIELAQCDALSTPISIIMIMEGRIVARKMLEREDGTEATTEDISISLWEEVWTPTDQL